MSEPQIPDPSVPPASTGELVQAHEATIQRLKVLYTGWLTAANTWQLGIGDNQNSRLYRECAAELAAVLKASTPPPAPAPAQGWLVEELRAYLDALLIDGSNISEIRRSCFVPWESQWNSIVRDETAQREAK